MSDGRVVPLPATRSCHFGFTDGDLEAILGPRLPLFHRWMRGQTVGVCDGRTYNRDTLQYEPSGCGPHGAVTYSQDLAAFLRGLGPLD